MRTQEDVLLVASAQRNNKAFSSLYEKYYRKVYDYFWYRTNHDKDLAEDLLQDTFVRAFTHLASFRDRGYSYLAYLLVIAHNILVNHYRRKSPLTLDSLDEIATDIGETVESRSDGELLWRAVRQLPKTERDVLFMRYCDQLSIAEIAGVVSKSPNAVKLILSRGRKRLKGNTFVRLMEQDREDRIESVH